MSSAGPMPLDLFGYSAVAVTTAGFVLSRKARPATLALAAALAAALAGAFVLAPWQGYQEMRALGLRGSEDWVTIDKYTGMEWFRGGDWTLYAAAVACALATRLALRAQASLGRWDRMSAAAAALLLGAVTTFAALCAFRWTDETVCPADTWHQERHGVPLAGVYLTVLAGELGLLCAGGLVARGFGSRSSPPA